MTTGDKRSNYALKRYTSYNDMKLDFDMIRELYSSIFRRAYREHESYDISGVLDSSVLVQVDYSNSKFSIYPQSLKCMTASGRVINLDSSHTYNKPFENTVGYHYIIGANHCEIPNGVRNNPRSGDYEYDTYKNEVGTILNPNSVTDNGDGSITFDVNNLFQNGVDFSGNYVTVWMVEPLSNDNSVYIETCKVAYSAPNNTITTIGSFAQSNISTTTTDYYVAIFGIEIRKIDDVGLISNPFSNEHAILGKIYSDTTGGYIDIGFMNYLNYPKYHYITNEVSCNIAGVSASLWIATNDPRLIVRGCHDPRTNQHTTIAHEIANSEARESISYNGYEFYDKVPPAWSSSYDMKFLFNYYDGSSSNSYVIAGTTDRLYERDTTAGAGATWVAWSGAPTGVDWIGGGTNNAATGDVKFVFVDGTNSRIYTSDVVNGTLTQRNIIINGVSQTDFTSTGTSCIIFDVVYSNDEENPFWMIKTNSYDIFTSVDGITWTHSTLDFWAFPAVIVQPTSSSTYYDYHSRRLAYDSFKKRWLLLTRGAVLTDTDTIYYSEDNGVTWIEVVDAFRFQFYASTTTKSRRYVSPNNFFGHRAIATDGKGNVIVKIIKSREPTSDDMVKGAVMTFISRDSGSNWEPSYPKQIMPTNASYSGIDVWYDSVNGCFNTAMFGYDTENAAYARYLTTTFFERFTIP